MAENTASYIFETLTLEQLCFPPSNRRPRAMNLRALCLGLVVELVEVEASILEVRKSGGRAHKVKSYHRVASSFDGLILRRETMLVFSLVGLD